MNNQSTEDQGNEPQSIEEMMAQLMLTPEQEAEQLLSEFNEFAGSLANCSQFIPEDSLVKGKVENLYKALQDISKEDMLILFAAMDKANPDEMDEETSL